MFIEEITITTRKDLFVPKPAVREDENCISKPTGKLTYNSSLTSIKYKRACYFSSCNRRSASYAATISANFVSMVSK